MANAPTLSDNVIMELSANFEAWDESTRNNALVQSGIILKSPTLEQLSVQGGKFFELPFYNNNELCELEADAAVENGTLTPAGFKSGEMIAARLMREKQFNNNDLLTVSIGPANDPVSNIIANLSKFWENNMTKLTMYTMRGIIDQNLTMGTPDLVRDITEETVKTIDKDEIIKTLGLMGDAQDKYGTMIVHPVVYQRLQTLSLIATERITEQDINIDTCLGKRVIQDKSLTSKETVGATPNTDVYYTVFFKPGAFQYAETFAGYNPLELDRNNNVSFGQTLINTRKCMSLHPVGFSFTTGFAGVTPTNAELATAGNWTRTTTDPLNCKLAVLRSLG